MRTRKKPKFRQRNVHAEKSVWADEVLHSSGEYKDLMKVQDELHRLNTGRKKTIHILPVFLATLFIALMLSGIYFISGGTTGLSVSDKDTLNYHDSVDYSFNSSTTIPLVLEHPGMLRSLRMSGSALQDSDMRIYLETKGARYLVLDTDRFSSAPPITGLAIAENKTVLERNVSISVPVIENLTDLGADNLIIVDDTNATILDDQNISLDELSESRSSENISVENLTITPVEPIVELEPETIMPEITEPEVPTETITQTIELPFDSVCIDTCSLAGLNSSDLKLVIEVDEGSITIKDLSYSINVIDKTLKSKAKLGKHNKTLRNKYHVRGRSLDSQFETEFKGKRAKVKTKTKAIKSIDFNDIEVVNDEISLGVEDVDIDGFVQSFAIDPSQINFTDAIVTVIAKGETLMKCKDWDFESAVCTGTWEVFKDDLVPGQEYNFTLTPDDPGFGELPLFNVQRGTVTDTTTTITDTISSVVENRSFVLFTANTGDSTPDDRQFTPNISSATEVSFERYDGAGISATISYEVVESSFLNVQRGEQVLTSGTASADISIDAVNLSETFVIVYGRCADETTGDNHAGFFNANLTSTTNLRVTRGNAGKCAATVSWQVIEWDGASVQSGTSVIADNSDSTTASISSVDLTKSFLVFGSANVGTDPGMDSNLIRGNISSATQLSFTHEPGSTYASSQRVIVWYVVELSDASVQSDSVVLSADTTATLTSVDTSKSFHLSSGWNTGGGQTYANSLYISEITDATTLTFDKQTGSQTQNLIYYVVELNPSQVIWSSPSKSLGTALISSGNLTGSATLTASQDQTSVSVACTLGNCTDILDDWVDSSSMTDGQSTPVNFICINNSVGDHWAVFNVTSNDFTGYDLINVTCTFTAGSTVYWNVSSLDLGTTFENAGQLTSNASIISAGANNNVNVSCEGDCAVITDSWSDGTNMLDAQESGVEFTCSDSSVGSFTAVFNLTSVEDSIPDQISVNCTIIPEPSPPELVSISPANESSFNLSDLVTLNVTAIDNDTSTLCVEMYGSDTSPPTDLLYSSCSVENNSLAQYIWTAPVREDTADIYCMYHFDNRSEYGESNNVVNDFGGNCNDATCSSPACPTWNETGGKFAGAHHFDGVDDYLSLGATTVFDSAFTDKTVEVWYKADAITGTASRTIYEEGGATNGMNIYIYDGKLFAGAFCENCAPAWQGDWLNFTTTADEWHYVALIFAGSDNMTVIYDNQSQSVALSTGMNGHNGANNIGRNDGTKFHTGDDGSAGDFFTGYIDEFVVYWEALLTPEEALDHYRLKNGTYFWSTNVSDPILSDQSAQYEFNITKIIEEDLTPPAFVTGLANQSASYTWIYWNWTDPSDPDFDHVEVWLDNIFQLNTSNNFFNATGLIENTWHTIQTRTVDTNGNINTTWVNSTARTNTTDPVPPVINSLADSPDPLAEGSNISFIVNATDDVNLTQVLIEIDGVNYSMVQDTGFVGAPEQFFVDTFEDDDISDWTVTPGSTSGWYVTGTETPIGSYHTIARNTDSETIMEQTISSEGYSNISFSFWWSTDTNSFDAADYYIGEWYNGTGWTEVFNHGSGSSTVYQQVSYDLPESASDLSSFAIRFRCNVNLGTEGGNVDNITLVGTQSQEAKPDIWTFTFNTSGLGNGLQTYRIYASDAVNNTVSNYSNFTVIGTPNYSFYLVDPADLMTDNQSTAVYEISLTNDGNVVDSYNLEVTNYDAADTASLNQTTISNLGADQTAIVELSVASGTIGNYTVGVNATSVGNSSVTDKLNTTTEIVPYVAPPSNSLFFDNFESGSLATQGWISEGTGTPWFIETVDTPFGTYHAEAAPGGSETIMRQNISTTGFGSITLSFNWDTDLLDAGEYLRVAWYDGSTWNTVLNTNTNPGSYQSFELTLPVGAEDNPDFAIRFACLSNLPTEECKVDNVLVTGFDIYDPYVTDVQPQGVSYDFNKTVTVSANVTDNVAVDQVFVNLTWPGGSNYTELFDADNNSIYEINFTDLNYYGTYNFTIFSNDTSSNINSTESGYFYLLAPIRILNWSIQPDDDEFTEGTQINPLEDSNIDVNITITLTNTTVVDTCEIRIFNASDSYASPTKGPYYGTVSVVNNLTECFVNWTMEYWRPVGFYNVTMFVNRTDGINDTNISWYYYNELKSFYVNTSTIAFNSLPGTITNSTNAYPLGVKNTGNSLLNISINGTDFVGQSNPSFKIGIQNITYNETDIGSFLPITYFMTPIPSMQYLTPTTVEPLYFRGYAPLGIPAQEYNSNITFQAD